MKYKLDFYGRTEQGNRAQNQDNLVFFTNKYDYFLAIIADGMGGHPGGKVASKIAIDVLREYYDDINFKYIKEKKLKEIFLYSIQLVLDKMKEVSIEKKELIDMGTTLNINVFIDEYLYTLNIGDSRTSSITKKAVNSITIDQNLASMAKNYKKYNNYIGDGQSILTSSLGPKKELRVDLYKTKLNNNGFISITTDGVHNYVNEMEFLEILEESKELSSYTKDVIDKAFSNGSNDNMSCIMVKYER